MIGQAHFADKQLELAAEFAQYVADHPEVDEVLPSTSHVCFEIEGETEFNRYSQELAAKKCQEDGSAIVRIQTKGLAPPHGSRLIDPIIHAAPAST